MNNPLAVVLHFLKKKDRMKFELEIEIFFINKKLTHNFIT